MWWTVELSRCAHHCLNRGSCWGTSHSQPSCRCHAPFKGRYCEIEEVYNEWWFWTVIGLVGFLLIILPIIMFLFLRSQKKKGLKSGPDFL
ncbi:unnamed protein product, partial [Mesorhabditis belari]|uniref:EGF-like domain-containing protein n=1 Tax=Mesorhabditis belari TaxID=2138241 RepID=A0AAF3EYG1_9BILA